MSSYRLPLKENLRAISIQVELLRNLTLMTGKTSPTAGNGTFNGQKKKTFLRLDLSSA